LAISNALVALSGFLVVQYQRFADINMGIGIVIVGLGSVIIGEALGKALGWTKIQWRLLAIVLGTIVFREILAITLALGIDPNWLKLITALFVLAVVAMPALKQRG
jgi:putative ABC transport system permease protein